MNWTWLRRLGWPLLFNCVAVLVSGHAALNALSSRDFFWAVVFALIASAFLVGVLLHVAQHCLAGLVNHRCSAGGIYLFAAFTTALTVDDLMYMAEAGGRPYSGWVRALSTASLLGSLVLGFAFLTVLVKPRYGYIAALLGASLSWPCFAYLAWNLPWRDFIWLVTVHWDGELQVAAVFSLATGTVYSLVQLRRMQRTSAATHNTAEREQLNSPKLAG